VRAVPQYWHCGSVPASEGCNHYIWCTGNVAIQNLLLAQFLSFDSGFESFGLKVIGLYDIKITVFWDVTPCSLVGSNLLPPF